MTSDYILRYVGAFCKGAKHLGGGGGLIANFIICYVRLLFSQPLLIVQMGEFHFQ
jgi:hypothetical protein